MFFRLYAVFMNTSQKYIQLCFKQGNVTFANRKGKLVYFVFLKCRLGLEAKKEENLADWYSQVHFVHIIL